MMTGVGLCSQKLKNYRCAINRLRDRLAQLEEFDIITVRQLGYKATIKECKK